MTERINVSARVLVTVEVRHNGSWGKECKLDQVCRQAADSAVDCIRRATQKDRRLRIIGDTTKVISVITEEE